MALTDVNGVPLKFEAEADFSKMEFDAEKALQRISKKGGLTLKSIMSELKIDSTPAIKSISDIAKESARTATITGTLKTAFESLTGSVDGVHANIAKVRAETQSLAETERDLRKALKENLITDDEYIDKLGILSQKRTELNEKLKEYRNELKQTQAEQSKTKPYTSADTAFEIANQHGSEKPFIPLPSLTAIEELKQAMKQLEAQEESLSKSFMDGSISSQEFEKAIEGVKKEQEKLVFQMSESKKGEFFDWSIITKDTKEQIDTLSSLNDKLKELKKTASETEIGDGLNAINKDIEKLEDEIKRATQAGKVGFDAFGFAIEESKQAIPKLQTELRALIDEMARMRAGGQVNTKEYDDLKQKAAELKKAIKDVNMEIAAGASRTGNLDNAIRSVQTLTAAYSIAQSASMMLGGKNEDLQKQLMKVAAAMSLLQGLQTIQNELKRADSILTVAQTAAQRAYAIAVGSSTGAMKAFRIALASTGVGFLVIALGSLIANFDRVTGAVNKFLPAGKSVQKMFDNIKTYAMGVGETVFKYIAMPFKAVAAVLRGDLQGFKDAIIEGHSFKSNFTKGVQEQEIRSLKAHERKKEEEAIKVEERELERAKNRGEKTLQSEIALQKRRLALYEKGTKEFEAEEIKLQNLQDSAVRDANKKVSTRAADAEANKRQALLDKLDDMNTDYLRKSMTQDEQEYQSIVDKYAKMRREIEQFNATAKKVDKINIVEFDKVAKIAIDDVLYRQDTKVLANEIAKQKLIFQNYESFKTQVSEAEAEKRYGTLKAEFDTYEKYLESEIQALDKLEQERKTLGKELTGAEKERQKMFTDERTKVQDKRAEKEASDAIASHNFAKNHAQDLLDIETKYTKLRDDLGKNASKEQLAVLDKKQKEETASIVLAEVKKSEIYKKANEQAILLTREQIKEQIKALRTLLDNDDIVGELRDKLKANLEGLEFSLKIGVDEANIRELEKKKEELLSSIKEIKLKNFSSPEIDAELKRLRELLVGVQIEIDTINETGLKKFFSYLKGDAAEIAQGLSNDLRDLSGSFFDLSNALGGVNTQAGYALDTVGQLATVGADAGEAFVAFYKGDIIGGIMGTVKAVSGLLSVGKKVKEMNAKARKEVEDYYENAIKGERAYQDALKARELQIIRNNKAVIQGIQDELALRNEMNNQALKEADEIKKKLGGMSYVSDTTYKHGTWFRKAKTTNHYESLAGKDFDDYKLLLNQGKLEGEAKALVERLVELEKQGFDSAQAVAGLNKELKEVFTGTTSDSLSNSLLNMFKEGKTGADDLAKFFKESMKQSMMSTFKDTVLDKAMADFYEKFNASASSGKILTDAEIKTLWDDFQAETSKAQEEWERFLQVSGLSFEDAVKNTGISLESVQDQFAALFANGTASAEEFGKSFQEIMRAVLMNSFQVNYLKDALEPWYAEIAELTKDGDKLTREDMARLEEQWNNIKEGSEAYIKNIEDISGFKFSADPIAKIAEKLPGISGDILNAITKPIEEGVDTFEESMKRAILNTFHDEILEKEMQAFYQLYADMTEGGASLTAANIDLLRAKYAEIMAFGKDEIEKLEKETGIVLKEIEKTVRENLTGTTLEGLANDISKIFSEPKDDVIDLAKTFEETMKAAILNVFRSQLVKGELAAFYETFEEIAQSKDGLTAANMAQLRIQYDLMMAGADEKFRNLEKITGISLKVTKEVQKIVEIARESILGTTFESFADGIVEMLSRGTTSVQEFGKSFEETMKTAILNTFKTKTLAKEMEAFYEQFYQYANAGQLDELRIAQLKTQYDAMIKKGREEMDKLGIVTGIDFTTDASSSGMTGTIRREITEETGSKIEALGRAQYENSKQLLDFYMKQAQISNNYNRMVIEDLSAINRNTLRTADNTERLANIESHLARMSGANGGLSGSKYLG